MGTGGIALATDTRGAMDFFLKLDGIDGESQDSKHKGEFQLLNFTFGATQAHARDFVGGGHGAGKARQPKAHALLRYRSTYSQSGSDSPEGRKGSTGVSQGHLQ